MNKLRALITTVAIATITTVTAQADNKAEKEISFDNNGVISTYETNAETLGEFLQTVDDSVVDSYVINENLDTALTEENVFQVEEKVNVKINIANGETIVEKYPKGITIGEIIEDLEDKNPGKKYYYEVGDLDKQINYNYILNFTSADVEITQEVKPIPYETTTVETEDLYVGESEVETEGVDGKHAVEVTNVYYKGVLTDSSEEELELMQEPVTEVVLVGTKEKPTFELGAETSVNPEDLDYSQKITMNASAYTCEGYTGVTASGRTAQRGVVAVDTSVIPMGTKLYIEGYGYAVAGDTGGAIKGNKVDLYMDTVKECLNFGRRNVDVYVLND